MSEYLTPITDEQAAQLSEAAAQAGAEYYGVPVETTRAILAVPRARSWVPYVFTADDEAWMNRLGELRAWYEQSPEKPDFDEVFDRISVQVRSVTR